MNPIRKVAASTRFFKAGFRTLRIAIAALVLAATAPVHALDDTGTAGSASVLNNRFAALKDELANNQFQRPLHLKSTEARDLLAGEIYAVVNHPFASTSGTLSQAGQWCDVLILHLNTKYCRPAAVDDVTQLRVSVGKKFDQPLEDAFRVDFVYKLIARTDNYMQVRLNADEGPLSTRNYRIILEATPGPNNQTYLRLAYSYSYGTMAQLAMKAYLGTIGRNKVGFTIVAQPDGKSEPIGGMRGVVERNTMRYYLAIEAFLGALSLPPAARAEKSFRDWFAATENYPRQLHEMEQAEYLAMKRKEYQRQQES